MNIKEKVKINPVLRNESKLSIRSPKFSIMIFVYTVILSVISLLQFYISNKTAYVSGVILKETINLYISIAFVQAILLMFIVPSLTSTSICGEREKQTLDILLSSKMTPLQIVIGKLVSSCGKVIILIMCTLPIYSISFLVGGVNFYNVLMLCLFFIVNTIFVGSIGIFISTIVKTSKVATAVAYATVLILFIGLFVAFMIGFTIQQRTMMMPTTIDIPVYMYLNPLTGFISLLINQIGVSTDMMIGGGNPFYYFISDLFRQIDIPKYTHLVSMAIQIVISCILIYGASYMLNPLKKRLKK